MRILKVVVATRSDAASIVQLVNAAYRGDGAVGWTDETSLLSGARVQEADVVSLIDGHPRTTVLIARRDGGTELLGCVCVEIDEGDCTISMLAVDPDSQASGYGRSLLEAAEQYASRNGARVAGMTVIEQRDTLIAWYRRRGYELTGEIEPFPYSDQSVGTPLRDDLRFLLLNKTIGTAAAVRPPR
jgi:ribosomal protein S18 acetylase RimI-like enzyme